MTYNPVGATCSHKCSYCWSQGERGLIKTRKMRKYQRGTELHLKMLSKRFKAGNTIFLCDMIDLFDKEIPQSIIQKVLKIPYRNPDSFFLLLTKNPSRYFQFVSYFTNNIFLGATIESDIDYPDLSDAPVQSDRIYEMKRLASLNILQNPLFISIEPILEFSNNFDLATEMATIKPSMGVAVGYDNHRCRLPEPNLTKTKALIRKLREECQLTVWEKTLRPAWNE
jgi:protein gp37